MGSATAAMMRTVESATMEMAVMQAVVEVMEAAANEADAITVIGPTVIPVRPVVPRATVSGRPWVVRNRHHAELRARRRRRVRRWRNARIRAWLTWHGLIAVARLIDAACERKRHRERNKRKTRTETHRAPRLHGAPHELTCGNGASRNKSKRFPAAMKNMRGSRHTAPHFRLGMPPAYRNHKDSALSNFAHRSQTAWR